MVLWAFIWYPRKVPLKIIPSMLYFFFMISIVFTVCEQFLEILGFHTNIVGLYICLYWTYTILGHVVVIAHLVKPVGIPCIIAQQMESWLSIISDLQKLSCSVQIYNKMKVVIDSCQLINIPATSLTDLNTNWKLKYNFRNNHKISHAKRTSF